MTTATESGTARAEMAFRQYSNALQLVLVDFQFIEESLRLYIAVAYDLIRHQTAEKLPFNFTAADVGKDALGRLVDKYAKFSNNTALIAALRELQPKRNEIAHRGLLLSLEQQRDAAFLDEQTNRLTELHVRAREQLQTLLNERSALLGERQVVI